MSSHDSNPSARWLSEKSVSAMTEISLSTLQKHRLKNKGFPYVKIGKSVRYSEADVIEYMERQKVIPINGIGISPSV